MESSRELLRVIKDLKSIVTELNANYHEQGLPVTDGSQELQQFCAQLEFLLQYDLKEKRHFFGQKKDYWDLLSRVLTKLHGGPHAGVQHVTSMDNPKTAMGKGRAFIRYCLVHQELAETLQLCFMEPEVTSEWYYARSPFLDQKLWLDILGSLYELDGVAFHLVPCRADLDAAWPMGSETLPRCSGSSTSNTKVNKPTCEDGSSGRNTVSHEEASQSLESSSQTKAHYGLDTTPNNILRPQLENSVEKWIEGLRRRKNSLLQMGSLLKLNPFTERQVHHPVSDKEVQRLKGESKAPQLEEQSTEQPSNNSSTQELYSLLSHPQGHICGNMDSPPQMMLEGDSCWKQKDLRIFMWELDDLQMKLAKQQEENASLRQILSEENQALKEELAKHEEQHRKNIEEQEKQQQELAQVGKSLREAEEKIAKLTSECQEAWTKKDAAERSLEEAEQRLSSLEAERRKHLANVEVQELRHQLISSQCQALQDKLKVCEESLERWETQVAALNSHHSQLAMTKGLSEGTSCKPAETVLEMSLLKEKLERSLAEIKALERERESFLETLVSQKQSLMSAKLETEDLHKELLLCQEHVVTLQTSLKEQEKALRNKEEETRGLQKDLNDHLGQLQEAWGEKTALEAQLQETSSKKSQIEVQIAKEQDSCEKTLKELKGQLEALEKEATRLQVEKEQVQAVLQQVLEERGVLVKHAESTAASLEARTQEVSQLRGELEDLKSTSQALQKSLQEENGTVTSALRQECLQLKSQVEQLEDEKVQTTSMAKKLNEELEQCWAWLTEDDSLQRSSNEEAKCLVMDAEENSYGIGRSGLVDKDLLQAGVLHDLGRPDKKVSNGKHRTEAHGKCLTSHLEKIIGGVQQVKQTLLTKDKTTKHLMEQLSQSQQEKEDLKLTLEKINQESEEKEKKYKQELSEQGELICSMKRKLLELLREKDALWQKTEGLASAPVCSPTQISGMCTLCKKDFRLMSRRYQCSLCRHTVCHACSVSSGQKERCCLSCHQKRKGQST